jgi:uncharacterized membrane protein (UPF0127 family)
MKIVNITKKTTVAERVEVARSFWKKSLGLMFRKGIPEDHCLMMEFSGEGRYGIWMMFMRFPIDLIFLDARKRVVGLFEHAMPLGFNKKSWKVYYPEKEAKWILELKAGAVKRSCSRKGDLITF